METFELISSLMKLGVQLHVDDNKLKVKAQPGVLTAEFQDLIKENKEALIKFLQGLEVKFAIEKAPIKDSYAPSSAQKRLYFLYQFKSKSLAYNMSQFVRFQGNLDVQKLEKIFKELIVRHEGFRTSFQIIDEELVQVIVDEVDFKVDYFEVEPSEVQPIVDNFVKPFDLLNPPLIRVGVIKTGPDIFILMLDVHHIITDGVSQGILIKDFMALYNDEELPEMRLQYKDFSEWQQNEEHRDSLVDQRQFWLDQFEEEVQVLEIPCDFPRPKVKGFMGRRIGFTIDEEDTARLRHITKQAGGTMFMALLAIFNILLSKLSNQEDIIVGIPAAGRENEDLQGIIGMFINTLALRNNPKGSLNFTEFLLEVQTNTLRCLENQSFQYQDLIESLQIIRDTSRNPLFDTMFSFENFVEVEFEIPDLKILPFGKEQKIITAMEFDLSLTGKETKDKIDLLFDASTDIFEEASIDRFVTYFKRIVKEVCKHPTQKISDLNMLDEAEKNKLVFSYNETTVSYPDQKSIIELFDAQVTKTPERIALIHNETEITYEELNQKANKLAHSLAQAGVEEGTVIGLMLPRSMAGIVGILGILKVSAVYLPLDKEQPMSRIAYILSDSNAKLLLTDEDCSFDGVKNYSMAEMLNNDQTTFTTRKTASEAPAYIIYTSGSTGRPKGVLIKQQSVINLISAKRRMYNFDETERILQLSTLVFDVSMEQIWLSLLSGAALVLVDKAMINNNILLERYIVDKKITHFPVTPSYLERIELAGNDSLKRIASAGEECKASLVRKFVDRYDFYNEYGPTEATVITSAKYFAKGYSFDNEVVTIGRPIDNTFVYILGRYEELLPAGSIGELCIGGDALAVGYVNDDELTREKFVDNPWIEGQKIYKTGDWARWSADGEIEYLGRMDNQVKIRGFRIELGEIENQLASFEQIQDTVVTLLEKESDKFLVAYYVSDSEIPVSELRSYLLSRLTDYMVPHIFIHLTSFPLTINGKLNRKALPKPEFTVGEDYVGASNPIEEKLIEFWSEVLKLDEAEISVTSSFFELGGHSLNAMVLINKINKEFKKEMPLTILFQITTVRGVASFLLSAQKNEDNLTMAGDNEEFSF
jgi:amino acid adenylation domain-containing protein